MEPAGQFTFGLMLDPEPGKLDDDRAGDIAGFADPLADPLGMKQSLDAVRVCRLLQQQAKLPSRFAQFKDQ
jgi:hypothetical protein